MSIVFFWVWAVCAWEIAVGRLLGGVPVVSVGRSGTCVRYLVFDFSRPQKIRAGCEWCSARGDPWCAPRFGRSKHSESKTLRRGFLNRSDQVRNPSTWQRVECVDGEQAREFVERTHPDVHAATFFERRSLHLVTPDHSISECVSPRCGKSVENWVDVYYLRLPRDSAVFAWSLVVASLWFACVKSERNLAPYVGGKPLLERRCN